MNHAALYRYEGRLHLPQLALRPASRLQSNLQLAEPQPQRQSSTRSRQMRRQTVMISVATSDTSSLAPSVDDTPVATPRTEHIPRAARRRRRRKSRRAMYFRGGVSSIAMNETKMKLIELKNKKVALEITKLERWLDNKIYS